MNKTKNYYLLIITFLILIINSSLSLLFNTKIIENATNLLEILFIILVIFNISLNDKKHVVIGVSFLFFLSIITLYSLYISDSLYDITRAQKWLFYFGMIFFTQKKRNSLQFEEILRVYKLLTISTLTIYSLQFIKFGIKTRPSLFTENNYEIALIIEFFLIIFFMAKKNNEELNSIWLWILVPITLLSSSRSGAISLFLVVALLPRYRKKILKTFSFSRNRNIFVICLSIWSLLFVIENRNQSIFSSDRANFFRIFVEELQKKGISEILFGNFQIIPLPVSVCEQFNYYSSLFQDHIAGSCFSVVFHSFVLRLIWDFGILGLIICFTAVFFATNSEFTNSFRLLVLIIALVNATSVSGPNNVYVVFPILLSRIASLKHDSKL